MNHLEIINLWIDALKIKSDKYTIQVEENDNNILFKILIDKSNIGKILGVSGSIYLALKRLLNSSYRKYNKKIKIEVNER